MIFQKPLWYIDLVLIIFLSTVKTDVLLKIICANRCTFFVSGFFK